MVSSVSSADAPYGRIGQYAYVSAKQADAAKQALANAADSEQQKSNDASLAKLKDAASNFAGVYGGSTARASSSAAVTAQNISETATKDAPFGKIGDFAFSSAEQASKVKEALANAASSAPANPLASSDADADKAQSASSKDSPFGKIGNFAFASAEQASKVKAALGNSASAFITEASDDKSTSTAKAGENVVASNLSAEDKKTAAAFENLSKANAAYRSFAEKGVEASNGSNGAKA